MEHLALDIYIKNCFHWKNWSVPLLQFFLQYTQQGYTWGHNYRLILFLTASSEPLNNTQRQRLATKICSWLSLPLQIGVVSPEHILSGWGYSKEQLPRNVSGCLVKPIFTAMVLVIKNLISFTSLLIWYCTTYALILSQHLQRDRLRCTYSHF